mmetsp:Transcript_16875/g.23306  ORF Transcript_16875/g.23306 Transcript_16875/m.23306 type:complete len:186 (-) Transcript_16875:42-599(-)|eukprot:CAMPEP_0196579028 /NCGR_PEP_ID=MMETSP1081-20130531/15911_1 /TAXON_ID=36882 /ORGANISM="Pyramimonas amylifera, Strain CCMP720" /LENGTH=185 /DNA_ID=CAMNT_0041898459 /DNA_START=97 /DNA_END=654 /DNA_ORIENTATION=+
MMYSHVFNSSQLNVASHRLATNAFYSAKPTTISVATPKTLMRESVHHKFRSLRNQSNIIRKSSQVVKVSASDKNPAYNKEFGYSRKDVILIGGGLLVAGFGSYYGMLAAGVDMILAGNIELVVFTLGMTVAWTASYVFRVAKKDMTYVKQLKDYEDAVMQKRLDEMPDAEISSLMEELETESSRK